jgi:hypothetical protein
MREDGTAWIASMFCRSPKGDKKYKKIKSAFPILFDDSMKRWGSSMK